MILNEGRNKKRCYYETVRWNCANIKYIYKSCADPNKSWGKPVWTTATTIEWKSKVAIIALVILTPLKKEPAIVVRGSPPLYASSLVVFRRTLMALIDHTIVLSGKWSEFQLFRLQPVSQWNKIECAIDDDASPTHLFIHSCNRLALAVRRQILGWISSPRAAVRHLFLRITTKSLQWYAYAHRHWFGRSWLPDDPWVHEVRYE